MPRFRMPPGPPPGAPPNRLMHPHHNKFGPPHPPQQQPQPVCSIILVFLWQIHFLLIGFFLSLIFSEYVTTTTERH